jgi:hypothetical protein
MIAMLHQPQRHMPSCFIILPQTLIIVVVFVVIRRISSLIVDHCLAFFFAIFFFSGTPPIHLSAYQDGVTWYRSRVLELDWMTFSPSFPRDVGAFQVIPYQDGTRGNASSKRPRG